MYLAAGTEYSVDYCFSKVNGQGKTQAVHIEAQCTRGYSLCYSITQERMSTVREYPLLHYTFSRHDGNFGLGNFLQVLGNQTFNIC